MLCCRVEHEIFYDLGPGFWQSMNYGFNRTLKVSFDDYIFQKSHFLSQAW